MKLSYKWLKEYIDIKLPAVELADRLTMAGLEVEEVVSSQNFSGVVVGEVVTKEKHPDADKLNVAVVNVGKEKLQIVCGAQNLEAGQRVPVALVGAKLGDFEIGKAKLRGVESNGMICSEKELGISESHEGIMVLAKDAPVGADFGEYYGADEIIDIKVLANRPDCMSMIGLAREIAAITGDKLKLPEVGYKKSSKETTVKIVVTAPELCPRYLGLSAYGVSRNQTPNWMKERLLASGVRSIDLLVDISNYVMLEYGQPLHFFDLDLLKDNYIEVRSAHAGEEIVTLDGSKRKLIESNLVIADKKQAVAIAGVMGGETTEINTETKNIFIEAAVFDKASVRKTSRYLGLRSEAVARFEKGIGLATPELAIRRAAQLLSELAGAEIAKNIVEVGVKPKITKLNFSVSKLNAFLGTNYSETKVEKVLTSLGLVLNKKVEQHEVVVPEYRVDVCEPVDLYEEVARILGYETIAPTMPFGLTVAPVKNDFHEFLVKARHYFAGLGFSEIMTYSFASEKELAVTVTPSSEAFEVANPLVKEQRYLRTSLVPKMLESLSENQYHRDSVHFFEIGKTFHKNGNNLPIEKTWLQLGTFGGSSYPFSYGDAENFYDLRGAVDSFLKSLGVSGYDFSKIGDLGSISEVKPEVYGKFGLKKSVAVAQIDLEKLFSVMPEAKLYREFSRFQAVQRDITFILPNGIYVENVISKISHKLVKEIVVKDVYLDKKSGTSEKAVTIRLTIVSDDHTLTDKEVAVVTTYAGKEITKAGGKLQGVKE